MGGIFTVHPLKNWVQVKNHYGSQSELRMIGIKEGGNRLAKPTISLQLSGVAGSSREQQGVAGSSREQLDVARSSQEQLGVAKSSWEQQDTHMRSDDGGPWWSGWRVQSLSARPLESMNSFHMHDVMRMRHDRKKLMFQHLVCLGQRREYSLSLLIPILTLKSPGRMSAGPRGQPTLKEKRYRLILELSFLPLPGPLNKINEEIV